MNNRESVFKDARVAGGSLFEHRCLVGLVGDEGKKRTTATVVFASPAFLVQARETALIKLHHPKNEDLPLTKNKENRSPKMLNNGEIVGLDRGDPLPIGGAVALGLFVAKKRRGAQQTKKAAKELDISYEEMRLRQKAAKYRAKAAVSNRSRRIRKYEAKAASCDEQLRRFEESRRTSPESNVNYEPFTHATLVAGGDDAPSRHTAIRPSIYLPEAYNLRWNKG